MFCFFVIVSLCSYNHISRVFLPSFYRFATIGSKRKLCNSNQTHSSRFEMAINTGNPDLDSKVGDWLNWDKVPGFKTIKTSKANNIMLWIS